MVWREAGIGGHRILPNTNVAVAFGYANRDPAVFPNAEQFDIERDWTSHLALGSGIHYCLGARWRGSRRRMRSTRCSIRYEMIAPAARPGTRQCASNEIRALIRRMSRENPLWGARASTASC
jgi:hypothetical protein